MGVRQRHIISRSQSDSSQGFDELSDFKMGESILLLDLALSATEGTEEECFDMTEIFPGQEIAG